MGIQFETSRCIIQLVRSQSHVPDAALGRLKATIDASVAVVYGIDVTLIQGSSRGQAHVALARQVAMYLAHCVFGIPHADVGRIFNRDRTTVRHACALVEDRRDDPVFDRTLANLEEIVGRMARVSGISFGGEA